MKQKILLFTLVLMLAAFFSGCIGKTDEEIANQDEISAEASGLEFHKIGVATYNIKDAQIMMFKGYLDGYIKECFSDVTFLYSDSINSEEDMLQFLQSCADNGCEGIMLFYSGDLKKEMDFCAENHMYVIRASGNAADSEFEAVADNPYFLGEIGPGHEAEYQAAADMTASMYKEDGSYLILSGGTIMGNEMHRQRTIAMLDSLQQLSGITFEEGSEALAVTEKPLSMEKDGLKVMICPGYMELEQFAAPAAEAIESGEYTTLLSAIPVTSLMESLSASEILCGTIDCFSEDNYFGFKKGKIGYVAGKYESEIGPAFAALMNAVNGYADVYREDGKAFRLIQGFWTAADTDEYDRMYALAKGASINAYNYEDLYSVMLNINPDSTFADFKALVSAFSYEDCLARRAN